MKRTLLTLACILVLDISGPRWPPIGGKAVAAEVPADPAITAAVNDYRSVRKVGLALSVLGFLLGLARLGLSEFASERHRAQSLVALTAAIFLLLVADKVLAKGIAGWFNLPATSLPAFWQ